MPVTARMMRLVPNVLATRDPKLKQPGRKNITIPSLPVIPAEVWYFGWFFGAQLHPHVWCLEAAGIYTHNLLVHPKLHSVKPQ